MEDTKPDSENLTDKESSKDSESLLAKLGLARPKEAVDEDKADDAELGDTLETKKPGKEKYPKKRLGDKFGEVFSSLVSLGGEKSKTPQDGHEDKPEDLDSSLTETPETTDKLLQPEEMELPTEEKNKSESAGNSNGPEHIGNIVKRVEQSSSSALAAAERLNKKREIKARTRLRKLKKEAKTARHEREEFKKRQKEFEKKLDESIKESNKHSKKSVETQSQPVTSIEQTPKIASAPEKPPKLEISNEQLQKLVYPEREPKPETILEKVAEAAEKNAPLESLYERRHEVKDDANRQQRAKLSAVMKEQAKASKQLGLAAPTATTPKSSHYSAKGRAPSNEPTLYKQAIISGFATALGLLAIIIVMLVLA